MQGKSAADIGDWIREHSGDAADAPEFAECLAVNLIPRMLGPSPVVCHHSHPIALTSGTAPAGLPERLLSQLNALLHAVASLMLQVVQVSEYIC